GPDDAGVHSAGGLPREAAVERVVDVDLDEGDEPIEDLRDADVAHERLEVGETVHDGETPVEDVGVFLDLHLEIAVVIRHEPLVPAPARKHALEDAGDGSGPEPPKRFGQVAHALAEEEGGPKHVEGLGAALFLTRSPRLPAESDGGNRLVGRPREEL